MSLKTGKQLGSHLFLQIFLQPDLSPLSQEVMQAGERTAQQQGVCESAGISVEGQERDSFQFLWHGGQNGHFLCVDGEGLTCSFMIAESSLSMSL